MMIMNKCGLIQRGAAMEERIQFVRVHHKQEAHASQKMPSTYWSTDKRRAQVNDQELTKDDTVLFVTSEPSPVLKNNNPKSIVPCDVKSCCINCISDVDGGKAIFI